MALFGGNSGMMQMLGIDPGALDKIGDGLNARLAGFDAQLNEIKQILLVQNELLRQIYGAAIPQCDAAEIDHDRAADMPADAYEGINP